MRVLSGLVWSGPLALDEAHGERNGTIARIIGARAWMSLPKAVRVRFDRVEPALYRGRTETQLSLFGRVFAWALFPFGAPLPLFAGESDALVKVGVKHAGMSWTRTYRGPLGLASSVRSTKRPLADDGLFECCAGAQPFNGLSAQHTTPSCKDCRKLLHSGDNYVFPALEHYVTVGDYRALQVEVRLRHRASLVVPHPSRLLSQRGNCV